MSSQVMPPLTGTQQDISDLLERARRHEAEAEFLLAEAEFLRAEGPWTDSADALGREPTAVHLEESAANHYHKAADLFSKAGATRSLSSRHTQEGYKELELFASSLSKVIGALGRWSNSPHSKHLASALAPYAAGRSLPSHLNDTMARFLCVTAALGLWDELDRVDPRLSGLILSYYTREARLVDLTQRVGVSTARVRQLIARGIDLLWDALPDRDEPMPYHPWPFPFDKTIVFPKEALRKVRRHRPQSPATREKMRQQRRERAPEPVEKPHKRDRMRQMTQERWAISTERAMQDEIARRSREQLEPADPISEKRAAWLREMEYAWQVGVHTHSGLIERLDKILYVVQDAMLALKLSYGPWLRSTQLGHAHEACRGLERAYMMLLRIAPTEEPGPPWLIWSAWHDAWLHWMKETKAALCTARERIADLSSNG